jgi:hypothetical protein
LHTFRSLKKPSYKSATISLSPSQSKQPHSQQDQTVAQKNHTRGRPPNKEKTFLVSLLRASSTIQHNKHKTQQQRKQLHPPKGEKKNTNKPNQINKTHTNKSYNNNTSHLIRSNPTNETTREQQKIKSSQSRLQIRRKRTENSPEEKSKTEQ